MQTINNVFQNSIPGPSTGSSPQRCVKEKSFEDHFPSELSSSPAEVKELEKRLAIDKSKYSNSTKGVQNKSTWDIFFKKMNSDLTTR